MKLRIFAILSLLLISGCGAVVNPTAPELDLGATWESAFPAKYEGAWNQPDVPLTVDMVKQEPRADDGRDLPVGNAPTAFVEVDLTNTPARHAHICVGTVEKQGQTPDARGRTDQGFGTCKVLEKGTVRKGPNSLVFGKPAEESGWIWYLRIGVCLTNSVESTCGPRGLDYTWDQKIKIWVDDD